MKPWKKKFQDLYMTLDIKPFGKWKKAVRSYERNYGKKEIKEQLKEMENEKANKQHYRRSTGQGSTGQKA